ncbi:immunity 26/phosphotriesterase HocA family protein [Vibrio harveyi]|uniref:immunity 26/phosphotriesterase HocA family protein n=1 Tax=Vibrio harveyi TaxID=669 RepID=UPI003734ED91
MRNKKVKRRIGDIVKIVLEDGSLTFGHILEDPIIAFYDAKTEQVLPTEDIINLPVLFKVCVMNNAITSGRWEVIGNKELTQYLKEPVTFFRQDMLSKKFFLHTDSKEIPASREQCLGLERAAVWDAEHVEDRLRDHYAGVVNPWVESLRLK